MIVHLIVTQDRNFPKMFLALEIIRNFCRLWNNCIRFTTVYYSPKYPASGIVHIFRKMLKHCIMSNELSRFWSFLRNYPELKYDLRIIQHCIKGLFNNYLRIKLLFFLVRKQGFANKMNDVIILLFYRCLAWGNKKKTKSTLSRIFLLFQMETQWQCSLKCP